MGVGGRAGRWNLGRSETGQEVAQGGVHGSIGPGQDVVGYGTQRIEAQLPKAEVRETEVAEDSGAAPQPPNPSPSQEMPSKPVQASVHEVQPLIKGAGTVVVIDSASKGEDTTSNVSKYKSLEPGPDGRKDVIPPGHKDQLSPFMRQLLAATGPVIATVSSGMTSGFSAVLLPQLNAPGSDFPISIEEGSWIASTAALPMAPGCLLGGLLMEKIGRRLTIILLCIPFALGWGLQSAAPDVLSLCLGRALTGLGVGLLGAPGMVYIGETSSPDNRGFLLAAVSLAVSIGVAASHLIGALLPWRTAAGIGALVPVLAALMAYLSPESPLWLASRGRMREAAQVFRMLRGTDSEAEKELGDLISKSGPQKDGDNMKMEEISTIEGKSSANEDANADSALSKWIHRWGALLRRPSFIKPFFIMNLFFFIQQWCGVNAVTFYTVDIFKATASGDSGATVDEYTATGAVDAARILASIAACILLRKCGRRPLATASGIGSAASLLALAILLMLKTPSPAGEKGVGIENATSVTDLLGLPTGHETFNESVHILGESAFLKDDHPAGSLITNHTLNLAEEVVEDVVDAASFVWAWAPVICLVLYVLCSSVGLIPLPWVMTGEVFPVAGRGVGSGVTSCVGFLAFFSVVKTAPALFNSLGMGGAFCVYGAVVLLGTVLLHFTLPETKGRTLQEIEKSFGGSERKVRHVNGNGVV